LKQYTHFFWALALIFDLLIEDVFLSDFVSFKVALGENLLLSLV
jgi:hypothetical protein